MIRVWRGVGTGAGLFIILVLTLLALRLPVGDSLRLIWTGAFGDEAGVHRTLVRLIPLTLCGLGIIVAWRGGMYNIGGEGQFIAGGLVGCIVAKALLKMAHPPGWWLTDSAVLLGGIAGGAAWGALAGWLYVRRGVEVVISTILLNFIALQLLLYAVSGPLQEGKGQLPLTDKIPDALMLPRFNRQTDLHVGIFVAAFAVLAVFGWLFFTKSGFCLRVVGENPRVARANRIDAGRTRILAMAISGGLCGLAGGVEYVGVAGQLGNSFSQQWGFLAIPVALLAGLHPLILVLSGLYFAAILAGSKTMAGFTSDGTVLIYVVQAAAVLGLVALHAVRSRHPLATEVD